MILPGDVVRHVMGGAPGEARIAVNKIPGADPDWPGFVIVTNGLGATQLLEIAKCAVEHAPDPETKEAWKGLALQLINAAMGAIAS